MNKPEQQLSLPADHLEYPTERYKKLCRALRKTIIKEVDIFLDGLLPKLIQEQDDAHRAGIKLPIRTQLPIHLNFRLLVQMQSYEQLKAYKETQTK